MEEAAVPPAPPAKSSLDKQIVLSVQQIITYSVFLITFGASIYTFFKAIPQIDTLNKEVQKIDIDVAVFREKFSNLSILQPGLNQRDTIKSK